MLLGGIRVIQFSLRKWGAAGTAQNWNSEMVNVPSLEVCKARFDGVWRNKV